MIDLKEIIIGFNKVNNFYIFFETESRFIKSLGEPLGKSFCSENNLKISCEIEEKKWNN